MPFFFVEINQNHSQSYIVRADTRENAEISAIAAASGKPVDAKLGSVKCTRRDSAKAVEISVATQDVWAQTDDIDK